MLQDYTLGRSTRKCRVSDRPLRIGESYYSVVVPDGSDISRYEVSEEAWSGPPENAIGWWRGKVAPVTTQQRIPTPVGELLEILAELCDDPERADLANLLGTFLLRRRILQANNTTASELASSHLELVHPSSQNRFLVPAIDLNLDSIEALNGALQSLLYREG